MRIKIVQQHRGTCLVNRLAIRDREHLHRICTFNQRQCIGVRARKGDSNPKYSNVRAGSVRNDGVVDIFFLRHMHANQSFDCLDDALCIADQVMVDFLQR